ncbi:hypothetical protein P167DRAFT_129150 [Morchella conica CCBAS932]|uniref:Secreted protein n=1 Tax=Morchella conica CCBAS932 TaxID=1392247 RepID=A0A3N4L3F0_9PEZI|nr:hypothetical protein P167DRAFT_129150 [Morchella conica CCBAS932]
MFVSFLFLLVLDLFSFFLSDVMEPLFSVPTRLLLTAHISRPFPLPIRTVSPARRCSLPTYLSPGVRRGGLAFLLYPVNTYSLFFPTTLRTHERTARILLAAHQDPIAVGYCCGGDAMVHLPACLCCRHRAVWFRAVVLGIARANQPSFTCKSGCLPVPREY